MSKTPCIDKYFQKVTRQPELQDRTDEQPLTSSQDSTESTVLPPNQNVPEQDQEIRNPANLLQTPYQPSNYNFPKKLYGKQHRSVQSTWFSEYSWLHYDDNKDALLCYVCLNQYLKGKFLIFFFVFVVFN